MKNTKISKIAKIGIFGAISAVFMIFLQFVILPPVPFLRYDPSDIPALVISFALGPFSGLAVVFIKEILFSLLKFDPQNLIGVPMDFAASGVFVFLSGFLYQMKKTRTSAMFALSVSIVAMALIMSALNYFVVPLYMKLFFPDFKITSEQLLKLIYTGIIPFNFIKGSLNAVITILIYKKLSGILR